MSEIGAIPLKIRVGKRFTITIPKEVRGRLGIKEGDELDLIIIDNGIILRKPMSLIVFINSVKPRGSIKAFLKGREEEGDAEHERAKELTE